MPRLSIMVDIDRCIGCYACEVACKQENNIPVGPRWIRVVKAGPTKVGGKLFLNFIPLTCTHCGKPPCMDVCPVDAITQRPDGIVLVDAEICNGCKRCIEVCPFGAPQFSPEKGVVEKCTLCVHRVDEGLEPACVIHCPGNALYFGDVNGFTENVRKKWAAKINKSRIKSEKLVKLK